MREKDRIPRDLDTDEPKSRAKRIRMLLKKNNKVFGDKQMLTDFKEPVLFLRRRSGTTEIFEDASRGSFVFNHSDGKTREIYLEPSTQGTMDYGKRRFKYYFCHEDYPLPLPENPLVTSSTINEIVEKSTMDMKKLNLKAMDVKLKTWKVLGWFVLGLALLFILYKTHAFDKLVGMITGQPYSANTQNVIQGGGSAIEIVRNNSVVVSAK